VAPTCTPRVRILRQIGAVLGVPWTAVGHQLRQAGVTMRRGGPPAHAACTDQIMELRDQGVTWNEIAEQVDMIFGCVEPLPEGQAARVSTLGSLAAGSRRRT
jgi:hypothetical protein